MAKPTFDLQDRPAIITGAGGGIGAASAKLIAQAGAKVLLVGTTKSKLEAVRDDLAADGLKAEILAVNLTDPDGPDKMVAVCQEKLGPPEILVNSAGINRPQKAEETTAENWDAIMDINLKALFFCCQAAGRVMIERKKGTIINISSQAGSVGLPLRAAYCASKGGVDQLTRVLALEWAPHGVNCNAVAPTFVQTPLTAGMLADKDFHDYVIGSIPMGRMAMPEEVAHAVLYLACDFSKIITGHILMVDGGWTMK